MPNNEGDYLIVGSPFNRPWVAWSGTSLDGWGLFDQGKRFSSYEEAEKKLPDAVKDADRDDKAFGYAVFVAYLPQGTQNMEVFAPNKKTLMVDFKRNNVPSGQMDVLGIL